MLVIILLDASGCLPIAPIAEDTAIPKLIADANAAAPKATATPRSIIDFESILTPPLNEQTTYGSGSDVSRRPQAVCEFEHPMLLFNEILASETSKGYPAE